MKRAALTVDHRMERTVRDPLEQFRQIVMKDEWPEGTDPGVNPNIAPRDWFTREAVTGGMPSEPSPAPRDEAREDAYNRIMLAAGKLWAQPVSESNVMEFSEVVTEALAAAPRADRTISLAVARSAVEAAQEVIGQCDCIMSSDGQDDPKRLWREARDRFRAAARAPGRAE